MSFRTARRPDGRPLPSPSEAKALPFAAVIHYDEPGRRYLSAVDPQNAAKHLGDREHHGRRLWFTFATTFVLFVVGLGHLLRFFQSQQESDFMIALVLGALSAACSLQLRSLLRTISGAARIVTAPCPFPVPDRVLEDPHQAIQVLEQLQWAESADDIAPMHLGQARQMLGAR